MQSIDQVTIVTGAGSQGKALAFQFAAGARFIEENNIRAIYKPLKEPVIAGKMLREPVAPRWPFVIEQR